MKWRKQNECNICAYILCTKTHTPSSTASIEVPGLGIIDINNMISDELRESIAKEALFVLRQKMGLSQEIKKPTLEPQYWKNDIKIEEP